MTYYVSTNAYSLIILLFSVFLCIFLSCSVAVCFTVLCCRMFLLCTCIFTFVKPYTQTHSLVGLVLEPNVTSPSSSVCYHRLMKPDSLCRFFKPHIFWGCRAVTPKFELGRDFCTVLLPASFLFTRSKSSCSQKNRCR